MDGKAVECYWLSVDDEDGPVRVHPAADVRVRRLVDGGRFLCKMPLRSSSSSSSSSSTVSRNRSLRAICRFRRYMYARENEISSQRLSVIRRLQLRRDCDRATVRFHASNGSLDTDAVDGVSYCFVLRQPA